MDCSNVASLFQALGAALEFGALMSIIWKPLIRPGLQRLGRSTRAAATAIRTRIRRLLLGGGQPQTIHTDSASGRVKLSGHLDLKTDIRPGDDDPEAPDGERIDRLVAHLGHVERRVQRSEDKENKLEERLTGLAASSGEDLDTLRSSLDEMEVRNLRVRTREAAVLAVGVFISLVGAGIGAAC